MPIGIIINCSSVFLGGLLGSLSGGAIPERVCKALSPVFGLCSMAMGILYITKLHSLPAVILAVILGLLIGELLRLETRVLHGVGKLEGVLPARFFPASAADGEAKNQQLLSVLVLFCASGTGIFGAIESGMSGDHTVLITKSILDFFTAATFAIALGPIVSLIAIPQAIISLTLFFCASFIYPLTNEVMRSDFMACGGILMLAAGLRICEIKALPIVSMIPSMLLVMSLSFLWNAYLL